MNNESVCKLSRVAFWVSLEHYSQTQTNTIPPSLQLPTYNWSAWQLAEPVYENSENRQHLTAQAVQYHSLSGTISFRLQELTASQAKWRVGSIVYVWNVFVGARCADTCIQILYVNPDQLATLPPPPHIRKEMKTVGNPQANPLISLPLAIHGSPSFLCVKIGVFFCLLQRGVEGML